jgi:menaquinone reductase, iron-sulfur cluster-binding subunit
MIFGDLNDPSSEVSAARHAAGSFRLLEKLGTDPKIYYRSRRDWVRRMADAPKPGGAGGKENLRG